MTINHGHLLDCTCGGGKPDHGWFSPPEVHYCNCACCKEHVQADSEDAVAAAWNGAARRKMRGKAA